MVPDRTNVWYGNAAMKRAIRRILLILFGTGFLLPALAFAQVATSSVSAPAGSDDVHALVSFFVLAFQKQQWRLVASGALLLAVSVTRKLSLVQRLPTNLIPLGVMGLAIAASIGLGLASVPPISAKTIVLTSLSVGLVAIGGWDVFVRVIRPLFRR